MSIQSVLARRATRALAFLACLIPLTILLWRWDHHLLGANWIEAAQQWTGDWTLKFLIITLCITPLRRITRINNLILYRRMLGLYAFFYGCVHFSIYLYYDKQFDWTDIKGDFLTRRFYIAGLLAWTLLIPLALTSTNGWVRRLGGRRWARLHMLIYVSAPLGAIHYLWQGKTIVLRAVYFCIIVGGLLLYRVLVRLSNAKRAPAKRPTVSPARSA